jgi:hypothetical protein
MKNNIFKVCALGLVSVTLITGCNSKTVNTERKEKQETNEYVLVDKDISTVSSKVNDKNEIILESKAEDGDIIWSVNIGEPYNSDLKYFYGEKGSKGVYFANGGAIQLRDSKTGAVIWTSSEQVGFVFERIIETNGKVFALEKNESRDADEITYEYSMVVLDNEGTVLDYVNFKGIDNIDSNSIKTNNNNSIQMTTKDNKVITIDTNTYEYDIK